MTDTATDTELMGRTAALNALLAGTTSGEEVAAPTVALTGDTVYAGGDVERVLLTAANLVYRADGMLYRANAKVGDTVTLTVEQAKRLDGLGATSTREELERVPEPVAVEDPDTGATAEDHTTGADNPPTKVADVPEATSVDIPGTPASPAPAPTPTPSGTPLLTDDELGAAKGPDLLAYVTQNPGERARVRAIEETRAPSQQRVSIMRATEPTPDLDAEAAAKVAAQQSGE